MENTPPTADLLMVLGQITPLPEPFQQRVKEQLHTEHHPARQIILSPGETWRRIYFITKGFLRAYHLDSSGREHTTWFMGQNDLMISVHSFFTQTPAHEYIEVLQDCTLQSLTWSQLQGYYADFPQGNLIGRIVTEKYYILSEERSLNLRTQTQQERYQVLKSRHPNIDQLTTTANIASYLSISRETLSRIRSKLARSNDQKS